MSHPKLGALFVFVMLIGLTLVAQPWIEKLRHRDQLIEKRGQLVEASGAPIADAVVVFHFLGPGDACRAGRATRSDASGRFDLPDVAADVSFERTWTINLMMMGLWGYLPSYHWQIGVYAPGFVLSRPALPGEPPPLFYTLIDPDGTASGSVFEIKNVTMARTSFTPSDEITYLTRLKRALECAKMPERISAEVLPTTTEIERRIRELPCNMAPSTLISAQGVIDYAAALDYGTLMLLAPLEGPGAPVNWKIDLPADVVCRAGQGHPSDPVASSRP